MSFGKCLVRGNLKFVGEILPPPSYIAWRPEKLRGKFSLSLSFEQNKPCDLPLFSLSLSLVPSKRRLWVVPSFEDDEGGGGRMA